MKRVAVLSIGPLLSFACLLAISCAAASSSEEERPPVPLEDQRMRLVVHCSMKVVPPITFPSVDHPGMGNDGR